MELLKLSDSGLYCEVGDFFIDPWRPVDRALITHAHSDHARPGSRSYLCQADSAPVMRLRLGEDACIETTEYGETITINGVSVSFHPAGHIMGSAQIRVEYKGEAFVVSGDYKTDPDPTCLPFEPVACHTFISESTFGLPIYQWPDSKSVFSEINRWWCANRDQGKTSILFVYSLGKAQRVLLGIDSSIGSIHTHGAVENINEIYREVGVPLPVTHRVSGEKKEDWRGALILAPPSAQQSAWIKKFGSVSTGFASGWMRIRGARRRRAVDRGFVLSDHADWRGLHTAIESSGAATVLLTHGYTSAMVRCLTEKGLDARTLTTEFAADENGGE